MRRWRRGSRPRTRLSARNRPPIIGRRRAPRLRRRSDRRREHRGCVRAWVTTMTNWETRTSMLSYVFGIVLAGTATHEAASFEFDKFSPAPNYFSNYKNSIKFNENPTILSFDAPETTTP